jgi:hypothetical protein
VKRATLAALLLLAACTTPRQTVQPIGTAAKSSDFDAYPMRRVGLLVPDGEGLDSDFLRGLRDALASELAGRKPYEIVPLDALDMEAVDRLEPSHTGRVRAAPVLALAKRSSLDGLITTRVLEMRAYAPVRLVLGLDLIAVETGAVIWSGSVCVDASDGETRAAIRSWQKSVRGAGDNDRALDMLSPSRIAEFAALQSAMLL